ncbi:hypothetical protein [Paenibacillus donghaensis]|uniref:Uncharacterized protein n=1 Tax=Paenibacillus donghaensis TaxID=414771 RepID=A0A2Z2KAV0_9BACL|nr:hypothetical protein [Paenibacillus donghaensis]ASA23816.1 hypothetical protein B9T62_25350 [Paenibacillus donghaensis]
MKRWKKILIWIISIVVVLGIGGLFAANYAVDRLMNSMAEGFDLETDEPDVVIDETGTAPTEAPGTETTSEPAASADPAASASAPPKDEDKAVANSQNDGEAETGVEPTTAATAKPGSPSATAKPTAAQDGYSAEVSTDKAKDIKENVSVKEKADVASIVLGQLSVSDIKRLQDLASGGLSIDEKREARSILLGKLSDEQYNELSQIAKKYGVSQGKTKDQVLVEEQQESNKGSE